jgi:hypothetical protein
MSYDSDRLASLASSYNISPSTFGSNGTLAGASTTISIPLISLFIDQLHFFLGTLNQTGLELQVYAHGSACMESGSVSNITLNAARLRFITEQYSGKATNCDHSIAMTLGNTYTPQLQSLNGLVPFAWFGLRSLLTGAGLYNFTAISDYELLDEQNCTLQNGERIPNAIARLEPAPDNFKSQLYMQIPIIPVIHIDNR